MDDAQLAEIAARAKAATPGKWVTGNYDDPHGDPMIHAECGDWISTAGSGPSDAEFIAAARTDVPALIGEVTRLRGIVAAKDDEMKLREENFVVTLTDAMTRAKRAEGIVAAVEALHRPAMFGALSALTASGDAQFCEGCGHLWPCETRAALGGKP